jgi:hypothetical protein
MPLPHSRRPLGAALACLALAALAFPAAGSPQDGSGEPAAEEPAEPPAQDAARSAYGKLKRAELRHDRLVEKSGNDPSVRDLLIASARAHQRALVRFLEAFRKVDWDAWDVQKDADVLAAGLFVVGVNAMREDPATSARALEMLVSKLPGAAQAQRGRRMLPFVLASIGRLEQAEAAAGDTASREERGVRGELLELAGDIAGARGAVPAARKSYEAAADAFAAEAQAEADGGGEAPPDQDPPGRAGHRRGGDRSPEERAERLAAGFRVRAAHLAEPAPALPAATWIGGEPRAPREPSDRLALVVFLRGTHCGICRATLVDLVRRDAAYRDRGVDVIVLIRRGDEGVLVESAANTWDGQRIRLSTEEGFREHVAAFRERIGAAYPTGIVEGEASPYAQTSHTVWLVGRDGKVAAFLDTGAHHPTPDGPRMRHSRSRVYESALARLLDAKKAE